MHSTYDWITVALFGGIAILFLHRSAGPRIPGDHVLSYVPAASGCVAGDVLGNAGHDFAAIAVIAATIAYVLLWLRPGRTG